MSKKNASVLVSAAGVIGGFIDKLVAAFKKVGGTDDQLHQLLVGKQSEEFIAKVADLAMKMAKVVRDGFRIVVDYSKSLVHMIAAGDYDWVNSDISEDHFLVRGQGKVELNPELIHYGKFMDSDDIVRDMDNRGLRPATLPELLAFGATYPDKQREFPIVALGSVWRPWGGIRCVACLCGAGSRRVLFLFVWGGFWHGGFRFLAVRK